jgi:CBS domain-containing protein
MADERDRSLQEFIDASEKTLNEPAGGAVAFDENMLRLPLSVLGSRTPILVEPQVPVLEAIGVMQEARVGCVLVVLGGRLMGIFTERDVLLQVVGRDIDVLKTPVRRLMTADPEYLRPTDSIAYALNAMSLGGYRHVPLVDDARRPVGVVSVRDVINYLVRLFPKSVMNLPTMPRLNYARSREGP